MFSCLDLIVCLDNHCIHNASCENRGPCVFPGQIWQQLTFPGAVSIGHSICKVYVIGEHVSFDWATRVCRIFNTYVISFIIIKTTVSYEFNTLTHTPMIEQLHTYPIDLYVNLHIYIMLNTDWIHQHTVVEVYVDIRISRHFCKVPRMSR